MCGRFTMLKDELEVRRRFLIPSEITPFEKSYNVAPGQDILAVIHDGKKRRAGYLRWGLIPSWSKDEKIGYKMINARSETAHVKPSFKHLMERKRCLVVADSFYEWQQTDEGKLAQRIQVPSMPLFSFAALWDKWQDGEKTLFTCTLLTKASNEAMQDIHHRMPIILSEAEEEIWITDSFSSAEQAKAFLDEVGDLPFTHYTVSNVVNNVRNNDATCIEAIS